jgi:DNA-binding response OmpR family regulator
LSDRNISLGKVAIIEPNEQVVGLLRQSFEEAGFQIEVARTGDEGLKLCRTFLPQVVLINTHLPDRDAFELCQELRDTTRTGHVHIILLARDLDRKLRIKGLETGADDFVLIPFDPDELTLRVRNALRRAAANNLSDPVTGLPSGRLIRKRLRDLLGEEDWALLMLTVTHLEEFQSVHGFLAMQEVLRFVGNTLGEGVEEWGAPSDFLGHSDEGRFLVITDEDRADVLARRLTARIETAIETHHTFRERERGYMLIDEEGEDQLPLMSLSVHRVLASDGPFYDIRSLTGALGSLDL